MLPEAHFAILIFQIARDYDTKTEPFGKFAMKSFLILAAFRVWMASDQNYMLGTIYGHIPPHKTVLKKFQTGLLVVTMALWA